MHILIAIINLAIVALNLFMVLCLSLRQHKIGTNDISQRESLVIMCSHFIIVVLSTLMSIYILCP